MHTQVMSSFFSISYFLLLFLYVFPFTLVSLFIRIKSKLNSWIASCLDY